MQATAAHSPRQTSVQHSLCTGAGEQQGQVRKNRHQGINQTARQLQTYSATCCVNKQQGIKQTATQQGNYSATTGARRSLVTGARRQRPPLGVDGVLEIWSGELEMETWAGPLEPWPVGHSTCDTNTLAEVVRLSRTRTPCEAVSPPVTPSAIPLGYWIRIAD